MKKIFLLLFLLVITCQPSKVFAQKKIPILIYHSIDEFTGHGVEDLYVHPKEFEKQMLYLKQHGFTLLTFEDWKKRNKVKKPIFITFDDGYKNNLNAFSIFQKLKDDQFKPTGTVFVISDYIDWSNRLSKSDLKKMVDSGMFSIQSHTATHPNLTKITNYEYELNESKKKIQAITNKPVLALAYPYSLYDKKVIEETKKYYTYGITTIPELYVEKGKKDENYLLPRIYIKYSTTIDEFAKIVE
ncbi:polysaccharide deacetylase family protein [Gottfriedia solisilvae]|uniref:NodB homology domain-containing protein n=1 Tax=Gottfriedia solisilvae TaxID=1516104 RepID=A0A8J3AGU1_9BACI|nr:polysaccharide deacetylase family protein [Gottfriedia solisilvae]GGI13585.1 hypothetical protein GCM10007380_18650 [Gottfriedia solisilvae]